MIDSNAKYSQVLVTTTIGTANTDEGSKYFIYGQGLIYEEDSNGNLLIHHYDQVGSTTALTDLSGNSKETYEYSPYGELLSGDGSLTQFLYNGSYGVITDTDGLYYMRARYYNPTILRFINQDVVLGVLTDIQSLNRYAYCEGNPISFLDPFGLCHEDTAFMHDVAGVINGVATVLSEFGLAVVGEPIAIVINSFDIGLYAYDIAMDVIYNVDDDVLRSDLCKLLLDGLGIISGGIAKSAFNYIDKTWKLAESGEVVVNLNKLLFRDKLGSKFDFTAKWANGASITDFVVEKALDLMYALKKKIRKNKYNESG